MTGSAGLATAFHQEFGADGVQLWQAPPDDFDQADPDGWVGLGAVEIGRDASGLQSLGPCLLYTSDAADE